MVVLGMDEVGRGCWAGPMVVGAVVLKETIEGLRDSKQLSRVQREKLTTLIEESALAVALGWVWPVEIDELGLTKATSLAMNRALVEIDCMYDEIVIDGKFNFLPDNPKCRTQIKADKSVPCVSAASIIAKVSRDNYMRKIAKDFPDYGFERHLGYGTQLHLKSLKRLGVSILHRKSYKPINQFI